MTATTTPAPATPAPAEPGLWTRLSDALNPILVREVQQLLRSKLFVVALGVQLLAIVIMALVIAADGAEHMDGRDAFLGTLALINPIVLMLIPLQAFVGMQAELRGGVGEQLLLTRLTPGRIVRGKQVAALVQALLLLSVFGPVLAFTYLLRGVGVPTIAFFLVLALLACLVASSFAIATGTLARLRAIRSLLYAGTAIALGGAMMSVWVGLEEMVREVGHMLRDADFWLAMGMISTCMAFALLLFGMVARSLLTHPNENRSTGFRVLATAAIAAAFAWIVAPGPSTSMLRFAAPGVAIGGTVGLALFWLFALTEDERLSPRTRILVPRSRWLALLSVPFLPGGGRGVAFVIVSATVLFGGAMLAELLGTGKLFGREDEWAVAAGCVLYCIVYLGLGGIVRRWLPRGSAGNWIARFVPAFLVILGCVLPALLELLLSGSVRSWSMLHLTNPFWTLADAVHRDNGSLLALAAGASAVLLGSGPALQRGLREVLEASAARRRAP